MNESSIRSRLRAAIGESGYPPVLTSQIAARLGRPAAERQRHGSLMVLVEAVLAMAIVAGLVLAGQALHLKTSVIPGIAPPAGCISSAQLFTLFGPPGVTKMATPLTGWAAGGLRTTDGGSTWKYVGPQDMLAGVSAQARANGDYPAGYTDFYLDADHGWLMWPVSSSSACADHVAVSRTSDGGKTWTESQIPLALLLGQQASVFNPLFIDKKTGWAQVIVGQHLIQFEGEASITNEYLYATTDGGVSWKRVADLKQAGKCVTPGPMVFTSATDGWMASSCQNDVELVATADGGATWSVKKVASPAGFTCTCTAQLPHFFDANHGFVEALDSTIGPGNYHPYATSDGGATWHALPNMPATGYQFPADFADPNNFWLFETQPGANKGQPDQDWLYHSADQGQSWQVVSTSTPMLFWIGYYAFFDAQHGFVEQGNVGPPPNAPTKIEVTSDGGVTWQEISPVIK